jgi:hypothetical protein
VSVVYKYPLRPWSIFLDIPQGARILSCGAQGSEVVVWVLCDPDAPRVGRIVAGHPTGVKIPPALKDAEFVGTAQMDDGLVFHVFDGGENEGDGLP